MTPDPFLEPDSVTVTEVRCGLGLLPLVAIWLGCALAGAAAVLVYDHLRRKP